MEHWSLLLSIVIGALGIYYYLFKRFNFFKRHGVLHIPPIPVLGTMTPVVFRQISIGEFWQRLYNFRTDAKYYGFYAMTMPIFLVRDPELLKDILVKDFEKFHDRRPFGDVNDPLMNKNLFSLQGSKWQGIRTLISPAFTGHKMKFMYSQILECAVNSARFASSSAADQKELDTRDMFSRYTNDVIATCVFGIKTDTIKNPKNEFYVHGRNGTKFLETFIALLAFLRTFSLARILNLRMVDEKVTKFFLDTVKRVIEKRDAEKIIRPDMLQLLMDNRGKSVAGEELTLEDITAQTFVFYFAGFESTSTTISFLAHELAVHPDVQAKLRREIDQTLEETNGRITYDVINRMKYLDAVIKETSRMYPSTSFLERVCSKDYELPPALPGEKPFTMKKGMVLWVPIYSIQRDDQYYDQPEEFLPERFLDNVSYENSPYFMSFGLGRRMCIGFRLAMMMMKVMMFQLLARCELKPCAKTSKPLRLEKQSMQMLAEGGFWLSFQPRTDVHPALDSAVVVDDAVDP
ncbi:PREDICTED: cytochrome P450 9e2-like [Dinoponera quadriceps]|uniref:Cytochrome P450 9e2-like n=1 Tax=Dinoponera quadriceps TaxID=609295 RepID=A0A6P3XDR5_DINQU|nr:PREDICTED: cytochrome P450 9e2-like [Dinoponera quadriceps]